MAATTVASFEVLTGTFTGRWQSAVLSAAPNARAATPARAVDRRHPEGTFTIYSFCSETNCTDGGGPFTGLVSGTEGNLYGMTSFGGANGGGPFLRSPETAR